MKSERARTLWVVPLVGLTLTACTRTPPPATFKEPTATPSAAKAAALVSSEMPMATTRPEAPAPPSVRGGNAKLPTYHATGMVKSIDAATKFINIAHDDIPGYMNAMVMPFEAASPEQIATVSKGDKVKFSFTDDGNGRRVLQQLTKVP